MKTCETICVRMPNWIGDIVMALPALKSLRSQFPGSRLIVAALEDHLELFRYTDFKIDSLIPLQKNRLLLNSSVYRAAKIDTLYLFTNSFSSALEAFISGIKKRFGYSTDGRSFLLTGNIKKDKENESKNHIYYYLDMVSKIGIKTQDEKPILKNKNDYPEVLTASKWVKGKPTLGINPGAAYGSAKRWLPERFIKVARYFSSKDINVILFGTENECKDIIGLLDEKDKIINLVGKTSLSELISSISSCDLFLTNDSGPMHIASSLGIPLVALFGPTNRHNTAPAGGDFLILTTDEPCSPCMKRECPLKHHNCMHNISTEMVQDSLEKTVDKLGIK